MRHFTHVFWYSNEAHLYLLHDPTIVANLLQHRKIEFVEVVDCFMSNEAFDKECYTEGCSGAVFFRGFGMAVCLRCYAYMLQNGLFYELTRHYRESTMEANPDSASIDQLSLF